MNRYLDRKITAAQFDVALAEGKTRRLIQLECQAGDGAKTIDYAEIAESTARLLWMVAQYNTLVALRREEEG